MDTQEGIPVVYVPSAAVCRGGGGCLPGRCLLGGMSAQGGVSAQGMSAGGGCLPGGVCRGVSAQKGMGVSAWGGVSAQWCLPDTPSPLWTEWLSDRCKNTTLPQLRCGR